MVLTLGRLRVKSLRILSNRSKTYTWQKKSRVRRYRAWFRQKPHFLDQTSVSEKLINVLSNKSKERRHSKSGPRPGMLLLVDMLHHSVNSSSAVRLRKIILCDNQKKYRQLFKMVMKSHTSQCLKLNSNLEKPPKKILKPKKKPANFRAKTKFST